MRIISGIRRGKNLISPAGLTTRPTIDRIKGALFSAIQFDIKNKVVLDLFSGSGQLGLESLSRGAKYCYFNDNNKSAAEVIKKNVMSCGFEKISEITCKDYTECVKILNRESVSLVFLDPPYFMGIAQAALNELLDNKILQKNALIVVETDKIEEITVPNGISLIKEYVYGEIKIRILKKV